MHFYLDNPRGKDPGDAGMGGPVARRKVPPPGVAVQARLRLHRCPAFQGQKADSPAYLQEADT